ncbi:hypothetical protein GGX14DRAFT_599999 [Mycena pura]|uniref:Uncharacterized protein n=1 Tax=Mycena pura TaxID=153505 RepID=A0AAD6VNM8_9AGAR|nr:hypothetical protein GGX14DRAFT_599999 [Mycena pura]
MSRSLLRGFSGLYPEFYHNSLNSFGLLLGISPSLSAFIHGYSPALSSPPDSFILPHGIRDIPSNFRPNLQSAVQYTQDRQRDAWEQDMRQTGNLLRHMEVLFVGQHPDKGMHESIVDYHPFSRSEIGTSAAQEGTGSMETLVEQAELTLKIDITSRVSKAYASQVIERHSFLPIATAALFKSLKILHIFSMQEKPISEPEIPSEDNDCLWGIPFSSAVASHQHSKRSETTGRWLAHPNFVGKRIDVCVVPMQELTDIARRYPKLVSDGRINKTTYDRADAQKPGFLQPLNAKQQVRLKGLEWRRVKVKFPLGKDASMPVVTLRPCRTTYDGFHKETNKCISTAQGRVIIIGPDVDGYDGNIGEYAQTEPDANQLPSTFVNVKFARTRTDGRQIEQRHGRYHLHSLCRATNAPLPGFELICPPTDFEMDLSI